MPRTLTPRLPSFLGLLAALAGAVALAVPAGQAAAQQLEFTYQGRLVDSGAPANGVYDFTFFLYDAPEGDANWLAQPVCRPQVTVVDGVFTVDLDFQDGTFLPGSTYLEIAVGPPSDNPCSGDAGETILSPRQGLTPALFANDAARFGGQDPAYYLNAANLTGTIPSSQFAGTYGEFVSLTNPANLFMGNGAGINNLNATRVTGGTLADARLSTNVALLAGAQTFSGAKTFSAAPSFSAATPFSVTGTGLVANLNADKLDGLNSTQFVRTDAASTITAPTATTALTLIGASDFHPALDVGSNGSFAAVRISRLAGSLGAGLLIDDAAALNNGIAIHQSNTSSSGRGIDITQNAPGATGVYSSNSAPTGAATGVFASVSSLDGVGGDFSGGVGVRATGNGNDGVVARTSATSHSGVYGVNDLASGVGYGVYGQCITANGFGLFSNGRTGASGTKSFRIDHPADPTGKYLLHYSAESPEVLNLYRGTITLDGAGEATVLLPDYFAAINTSPSYQLTPIGAAMPGLFVRQVINADDLAAGAKAAPGEPIPQSFFIIAGGVPGAQVCWTVQAQRADRFVQTYGAPVEAPKEGRELGAYQLPELYAQPAAPGR